MNVGIIVVIHHHTTYVLIHLRIECTHTEISSRARAKKMRAGEKLLKPAIYLNEFFKCYVWKMYDA